MLSQNAEKIFKMKYAINENEDWGQACWRVASHAASAEQDEEKRKELEVQFFQMIYELVFLPGGRVLANAGTGITNLLNCFVLDIEDSREGIYKTLGEAAEIFAYGGGVGFNFSKLREEGANIDSSCGISGTTISCRRRT